MFSLLYLLLMSAKNDLLELRRKPGKLVLYLFVIAMIIFSVFMSVQQQQNTGIQTFNLAPLFYLKGLFFAFLMIFVVIALVKGLSSGDTFFGMNDVNLLFVSPISPKVILLYGLIRMAKMAFLSGFFILFQATSLGRAFGIGFGSLCLILLAYILGLMLAEIVALLIYSLTNGKPRRQTVVKAAGALCLLPAALYFIMQYLHVGYVPAALENTLASPFFIGIPVAGWASQAVFEVTSQNWMTGAAYFALILVTGALLVWVILISKADYYEDVLCATETAFEKTRAAAEGNVNAMSLNTRKIKVSGTGLFGYGAKALFGRHLRESLRENRFVVLSTSSVLTVAAVCVFSAFIGKDPFFLITAMQILMWMQVFMIGTGRGLKDLYMHYLYLIPAGSFSKIVWSNLELVFKTLIESVLMFGIAGLIHGYNVFLIIGVIVTYTLFTLLLIGINVFSLRWTSANLSAGILILVYLIAVLLIMAPGLVAALMIGFNLGGMAGALTGLLILACWELVAALGCFALARGVLDKYDMPVMPAKK